MMLKTSKKKSGRKKKERVRQDDDDDQDEDEDTQKTTATELRTEPDPDDPLLTTPMPRYNAMLAVLRNTLYMHVFIMSHSDTLRANSLASYGGIFERGSREYTLDDFYSLALDKMERYVCLKKSDVIIPSEGDDVSSSSEEEEEEDDDDESGDDSEEDGEGDEEVLPGEVEVSEIKVEEEVVAEPVSIVRGKRNSPCSPLKQIPNSRFPCATKQRPLWGSPKIPNVLRRMLSAPLFREKRLPFSMRVLVSFFFGNTHFRSNG
jgi:hypothetical protein